ncbi:MAG: leucyl aminopeptidase family protein [Chitinophagaceae bacterium]|nr:leucyl aminopeptidase family protein [Oligoflexus sp.]
MSQKERHLFGWNIKSWLASASFDPSETDTQIIYCGQQSDPVAVLQTLNDQLLPWQSKLVNFEETDLFSLAGKTGPLVILRPRSITEGQKRDGGLLAPSAYGLARDLMGRAFVELKKYRSARVKVKFVNATNEEIRGALVGLEMAAYAYRPLVQNQPLNLPQLVLDVDKKIWLEAQNLGIGVNIARHLVNTPPNILFPLSFALEASKLFDGNDIVSVSIWDEERLKRERMGLHLAVGSASQHRPCLLHVRYRPTGVKDQPIALVGKGVTFDSGGLDIKDPASMRLMKKDMGGAAAILGTLYWLVESKIQRNVDVYIPLAENAISGHSFRPSDILKARNGMTVEIHNTDAEGRLVLADAMAVAGEQKGADKPCAIIVAATLTGAIKIGLGADVAGFFTNDEELTTVITRQSQAHGDLMWHMPLFEGYRSRLETTVADINHCAVGSYGGAVTAALFLAEFAKGYPFAHLDIYAWADAERGALREAGGSGQAVQCLSGVLQQYHLS